MRDIITGIRQKVNELHKKAEEVIDLVRKKLDGEDVTEKLCLVAESWYQSTMALFRANDYSRIDDFSRKYEIVIIGFTSPGGYGKDFQHFSNIMIQMIALLRSFPDELENKSVTLFSQLNFEFIADEYEQAEELLKVHVRAAGAVAGVALERHVHTLANTKGVKVESHPSSKTKPDFSDYLNALKKADVINEVQKKQFEALYQVRKSSSHPEEVDPEDVKRLIREGKILASTIT